MVSKQCLFRMLPLLRLILTSPFAFREYHEHSICWIQLHPNPTSMPEILSQINDWSAIYASVLLQFLYHDIGICEYQEDYCQWQGRDAKSRHRRPTGRSPVSGVHLLPAVQSISAATFFGPEQTGWFPCNKCTTPMPQIYRHRWHRSYVKPI